eukprot:178869-Prymnesium_polylepis.2
MSDAGFPGRNHADVMHSSPAAPAPSVRLWSLANSADSGFERWVSIPWAVSGAGIGPGRPHSHPSLRGVCARAADVVQP